MNANPTASDVRQAVERAFTPDLSLIWHCSCLAEAVQIAEGAKP